MVPVRLLPLHLVLKFEATGKRKCMGRWREREENLHPLRWAGNCVGFSLALSFHSGGYSMGAKGLEVREAEEGLVEAGGDAGLLLPAPHQ